MKTLKEFLKFVVIVSDDNIHDIEGLYGEKTEKIPGYIAITHKNEQDALSTINTLESKGHKIKKFFI